MENTSTNITKRLLYIDVAKFFGMVLIYAGHFGTAVGLAYPFVFKFHVPLFFFLSGMTERFNKRDLKRSIIHRFESLILPLYFFAILSFIFSMLVDNGQIEIKKNLLVILKGCIRNQYFVSGLWFLSCLFVIQVIFDFLKQIKNSAYLLIIAVAFKIFAVIFLSDGYPKLVYNIDSACLYLMYFVFGYVFYEKINKLISYLKRGYIQNNIIVSVSIAYLLLEYFQKVDKLVNLSFIYNNDIINILVNDSRTILLIVVTLILASKLETIKTFSDLGKVSLYLCGNEFISKSIVMMFVTSLGLKFQLSNVIIAYIYIFVSFVIIQKYLIPFEMKFINYKKKGELIK